MRITFIVPTLNLSGGLRVVSIYARLLSERGHEITVISPSPRAPTIRERVKSMIRWKGYSYDHGFNRLFFDDVNYKLKLVEHCGPITSEDVADGDAVIATWWETAEWVNNFPASKGKKFYFVQHHETHNSTLSLSRVEKTYQMNMHKITISKWLVTVLKEKYHQTDVSLVPNSVDHTFFSAPPRNKQLRPTIGFLYTEAESKGVRTALAVIEKVKEQLPELRVLCFGVKEFESIPLPTGFELEIKPKQNQIRDLYAQCDVWLCCSLTEGFGLTVLEAMACRTPAVSTRCGGPEDIIEHGKTGYLCDVGDVSGISQSVLKLLISNEDQWQAFSLAAYEYANSYSWADSASLFESALK
jgi:glycosyltransferase involved in cell wall biosynthesis